MARTTFKFSRLGRPPVSYYALLAQMPKRCRQSSITALWETLPDADPKAVEKASFMLFKQSTDRPQSASTRQNSAALDKTHGSCNVQTARP